MGKVVRKIQCPDCLDTGEDNLSIFEDGGTFCFSCHAYTNGDEEFIAGPPTEKQPIPLEDITQYSLPSRGLSQATCEFFDIGINNASQNIIYTYHDSMGVPVAQKIRVPGDEKKFYITGDMSKGQLFGQHLWTARGKTGIVVTEGEPDACAVGQAQKCQWPVVSIPTGAAGAAASIKAQLLWLQQFEYVTLAFDNDEAGHLATDDCVKLFEPGKVKVVNWGKYKDANEALVDGADVNDLLRRAKTYCPESIITVSDLGDEVYQRVPVGVDWPWDGMTELTRGCRMRELSVVMGPPAAGKTTFILEILSHLAMKEGMKCGVMAFEQSAVETFQLLAGFHINKRIVDPYVQWDRSEIEEPLRLMENKIFTTDDMECKSFEDIARWILHFNISLGCKFLLIDNLSNIAATFNTDERIALDKAMVKLFQLAKTLDCHIMLISHVTDNTKGKSKRLEEGASLYLSDARGSTSIGSNCTFAFGLERDALNEDEHTANMLRVKCLKNRLVGSSRGKSFQLRYWENKGRLLEHKEQELI